MIIKKLLLAFLLIFSLIGGHTAFAENTNNEEYIEKKISENNELRRQKIIMFVEDKLDTFEKSSSYSSLSEDSQRRFYESLSLRIESQKEKIKNKNKKEIYEIFGELVEKRLSEFYSIGIEEQNIFLELLGEK